MSFETRVRFANLHASSGGAGGTIRRSDREAFRRETSLGNCEVRLGRRTTSSRPTRRPLSCPGCCSWGGIPPIVVVGKSCTEDVECHAFKFYYS